LEKWIVQPMNGF